MSPVYFDIVQRVIGIEASAAEVVEKSIKTGEQAGRGFADAFKDKVLGASASTTSSITTQINAAATALESASARVVKAKDAEANAVGRVRVAEQQLADARAKYDAETTKVIAAEERLAKAKRANVAASREVSTALAAEERAHSTLIAKQDKAASSASGVGLAMKAAAVTGVGAMGLALGDAVKSAGDFQSSQTQLVTTAGESQKALAGVSKGLLDMAGQVGYSAQDLSQAMYTVESGGYHGAQGLTVMKAAAQGAAQEHADLHDVVDALTTTMQDYHLPASQAAKVTSQMITAVSHGKTNFAEFSAALGSVQATAAAAKIPMDDLYASLAQMTLHGINADRATQNLNRAITTLQKPSAQMVTALANIGINAADLSDKLSTKGLSGTVQEISAAVMQHMGPAGKVMIDTFNQSKVAAQDVADAYAALPPKLQKVADAVKHGSVIPTVGKLENQGLDLAQANQVAQYAAMYKKATGLNSTLTGLQTHDKTYQQMMIAALGNQETVRVATNLTGTENATQVAATRADVQGAHGDPAGNVKGWSDVQGTFNQKLKETKASLGSMSIAIGTDLLPVATKMVGWLQTGATWLEKHKTDTEDVIKVVVGLGAAWAAWKVASGTFGLVKGGIEGIGGALKTIKGTPAAIGKAFGAISDGAQAASRIAGDASAYVSLRVEATKNFVATKAAAVANAAQTAGTWVASQARAGAGWVAMQAKAVGAFVATKVAAVANAAESAGAWVAQNARVVASFVAVNGAAIAASVAQKGMAAAMWLLDAATGPIGLVVIGITALVAAVIYAYNHFTWFRKGVNEAWSGIKKTFDEVWNGAVKPIFNDVKRVIGDVVDFAKNYFGMWIDLLTGNFSGAWNHVKKLVHDVVDAAKGYLDILGHAFKAVYDVTIKPVGKLIGDALGLVKTAFKDTVDWVSDQWTKIEKIVGTPAVAIIDLVYNDGIVKLWNGIADVFHLGKLNPVDTSKIPHYALGGILPGYSPGVDNFLVPTAGGGAAALGGGEAILRPEVTRAVGSDFIHGANAAAVRGGVGGVQSFLAGVPHFDGGGIFGDIVGGVEHIGKTIAHAVVDTAKFTAKLATDPVGAVTELFRPILDKAKGAPDGGSDGGTSKWRDMLIGVPAHVVDAVIQKAKDWLSGGGGQNAPGIPFVGSPDLAGWIAKAIAVAGVGAGWIPGIRTIIGRESSGNPNAINNWDINAKSGDPSRGLMQTIGATFEAYRDKSLPDNIYDPVANIVAGIHYIQARYGVNQAGSNLAALVQQADPSRPPHGYATGGIVPGAAGVTSTTKAASGPERALAQVHDHLATMYAWGGSDLATGVDCSGLVGDAIQIAEGITNPTLRLGDTTSLIAGKWPHVLTGATASDIFAIGANADHMAATILGTNIEARQNGEHIRYGTDAVSAFDPQFTWHGHLDPAVFSPPYVGTSSSSKKTPAEKAQAYKDSAQKQLDAAKASDAAADKHDQAVKDYQAKAAKAQALADKSSGAARQRHLNAVKTYNDDAQKAKAAADKARQQAEAHRQKAAQLQQKAQQAANQAPSTGKSSKSKSGTSSSSGGLLTFHQLGERAGGIAADAFLETFGLQDTLLADPNKSPLLRIAGSLGNLKVQGQPVFVNPLAPLGAQPATVPHAQPLVAAEPRTRALPVIPAPKPLTKAEQKRLSDQLPATHDAGGMLPPGISVVNNKTGVPELVLSPQQKLAPAAAPPAGGFTGMQGPLLNIEHWHAGERSGQAEANAIVREFNIYAGGLPR